MSFSDCPHLHEGVALQSESSTGDLFEALTHIRQRASSQDFRLMVNDECQSNTEKNFGAFVEDTIPDPQNCLQVQETRRTSVKVCFVGLICVQGYTLFFPHLNWEYVNVEANKPAWHNQGPYTRILGHELSHCRGFNLHQLPKNLLVSLQSQHGRTVVVYNRCVLVKTT